MNMEIDRKSRMRNREWEGSRGNSAPYPITIVVSQGCGAVATIRRKPGCLAGCDQFYASMQR